MGCCLSKKNPSQPNNFTPKPIQNYLKITTQKPQINNVASQLELHGKVPELELDQSHKNGVVEEEEKKEEDVKEVATAKKDVIQDRKGNDGLAPDSPDLGRNLMGEEEVDAISIQCERLSNGNGSGNVGRYSGSKRSFDFDKENEGFGNEEEGSRRRESRGSNRRRPASSRSRERVGEQRSGSKERNGGGGQSSRRVSRSPRRRSESPMSNGNGSVGSGNRVEKPGKLVSVPATVTSFSSLTTDTGTSGNVNVNGNRILARRNVGSPRSQSPAKGSQVSGNANGNGQSQTPAKGNQLGGNRRSQSPAKGNQVSVSGNGRCQSPAKGNQTNGNGNGGGLQQPVLSRNGSRKREKSPFRRTPLNEIDMNSLPFQPLADKRPLNKAKEIEENKDPTETDSGKTAVHVAHRRTRSRGAEGYEITKTNYCRVNDLHTPNHDQLNATEYETMVTPTELSGTETLKLPQTLARSRSARRSRDLDINLDALLTPTPTTNYTSLLLQDIQNFHQKKNSNSNCNSNCESTPTTFPACLSKTHSILETVADLNSATRVDPFVETEVKVGNNLMEPALHNYVTVRKRGGDINDEESSGSNSIVGNGHQNWVSSSSWEPNSADSTDCWTSKTYSRDDEISPVALQRHAISDIGGIIEDSGSKFRRSGRHLQSAPPLQIGATRSTTVTAAST